MKFSEKWLRDWVEPEVDTEGLVAQLTGAGLEVATVERLDAAVDGVVVAEVLSVKPHPDADRLRVCRVADGEGEPKIVVCGAPNVEAGMRVPFARPGARLAEGRRIRASRIRGVASDGMLCSPIEIGFGEDAEGLLALPADAPVGESLASYLGLDDHVIDIELTPNRGDCLSIAGIAREVGALNRVPVKGPAIDAVAPRIDDRFPVSLEAPEDCPRYVGRVIRDVDPGAPAPLWMRERLRRAGLRSISASVDVTNYVMLELGQPMHAFDLDRLSGGIEVRRARRGERLVLLDEREIELDPQGLVIADGRGPVALAGVMGGLESAVDSTTRHLFLESAWFEPRTVSMESRRRGLHTDSAHRFARGVAIDLQARAMERATALLIDIVGGRPGPLVDVTKEEALPRRTPIALRAARIRTLLGVDVPAQEVEESLGRLGMALEAEAQGWSVIPPAFRLDITIEADLIEEVARLRGYHTIPEIAPVGVLCAAPAPEGRIPLGDLRRRLAARGYHEAWTFSFVEPALQRRLEPEIEPLPLANPISTELSVMRVSLWPGLLRALLHNAHRQQDRVRLYEIGRRFLPQAGAAVREEEVVAGLAYGPVEPRQWGLPPRLGDFHDLKGDVEALLELGRRGDRFRFVGQVHPALHPGQCARILLEEEPVGWLGVLHPALAAEWKLAAQVLIFEVGLEAVRTADQPRHRALSRFPAVHRDIALVVDDAISVQAVHDCVGQLGLGVLKNLELFDLYRGEGIDSGKKSLALGLTFQHPSRTLTDVEVEVGVKRIIDSLAKHLGAALRG
jgi:phenylalanyl-tRNA synthetase beta chain